MVVLIKVSAGCIDKNLLVNKLTVSTYVPFMFHTFLLCFDDVVVTVLVTVGSMSHSLLYVYFFFFLLTVAAVLAQSSQCSQHSPRMN